MTARRRRILGRILLLLCCGWFFAFGYIGDVWGKKFKDVPVHVTIIFFLNGIGTAALGLYVALKEVEYSEKKK